MLTDDEMADEERYELTAESCLWFWEPMRKDEPFDFGRAEYLQRGIELMSELVRRRYSRTMPIFVWLNRVFYGVRALAYLLQARVNLTRIDAQEAARADI